MKLYDTIKMIPVADIKPYWRNPRTNEQTVRALMEIIPKSGFNVPLLVDDKNVIVKGHARYNAAKRLGITELPCIVSENDDDTNKADRIYDNGISELSEWNTDMLSVELRDMKLKLPNIDIPSFKLEYAEEKPENYQNIYDKKVSDSDIMKTQDAVGSELDNLNKDVLVKFTCTKCGETILVSKQKVMEFE